MNNEKELKRYFDSVERIVRNSFEYKQLVNFLKNYMDMNQCSFYQNVSGEDGYNIKIHIHHEPITLYDIVVAVFNNNVPLFKIKPFPDVTLKCPYKELVASP